MIEVQITRPNAFMATKNGDQRLKVGQRLKFDTDEIPTFLKGKATVLSGGGDQTLETGDSDVFTVGEEEFTAEEVKALYEERIGKAGNKKTETLVKELNEA